MIGEFNETIAAAAFGSISGAAGLGWWLSNQFKKMGDKIHDAKAELSTKIQIVKVELDLKIDAHSKDDAKHFNYIERRIDRIARHNRRGKGDDDNGYQEYGG